MTSIVADEDIEISQARWREAILPAIGLLRWMGGGIMFVPHDPEDLEPLP